MKGEVEMNPLRVNMLVGGVGGGEGGTGGTGRREACWWMEEPRSPLRQTGQFQPMVEPAVQIL